MNGLFSRWLNHVTRPEEMERKFYEKYSTPYEKSAVRALQVRLAKVEQRLNILEQQR